MVYCTGGRRKAILYPLTAFKMPGSCVDNKTIIVFIFRENVEFPQLEWEDKSCHRGQIEEEIDFQLHASLMCQISSPKLVVSSSGVSLLVIPPVME